MIGNIALTRYFDILLSPNYLVINHFPHFETIGLKLMKNKMHGIWFSCLF